jgi:radical SAM protein with 4Fe4S-binding SPASM domain
MKGRFDEQYAQYVASVLERLVSVGVPYEVFLIGEKLHRSISYVVAVHGKEVVQAKYLNTRVGAINAKNFNLKVSETIRDPSAKYYCGYRRLNQGVMLPNGNVALCCQDYGLEHVLGSLLETPLPELYTSIQRNQKTKIAFETGAFSPCNRCEHYRPMTEAQTNGRSD